MIFFLRNNLKLLFSSNDFAGCKSNEDDYLYKEERYKQRITAFLGRKRILHGLSSILIWY